MEPVISPLAVHVYQINRTIDEHDALIDDVLDVMARVKTCMEDNPEEWEIDIRFVQVSGKHVYNIKAKELAGSFTNKLAVVTGIIVGVLDEMWIGSSEQYVAIEVRYLQEEFFSMLSTYNRLMKKYVPLTINKKLMKAQREEIKNMMITQNKEDLRDIMETVTCLKRG